MTDYTKYQGYGLTQKSRDEWNSRTVQSPPELKTLKARRPVEKVRQLIEWAKVEYVTAREKFRGNFKVSVELTLLWNPQRVLSRNKEFLGMINSLGDETTWNLLTSKERKFIMDAITHSKRKGR